jgi:DNA-binding transcriptional MerR regulator
MQIGEMAERAGATTRAIRYYEQVGLIGPASRTDGGFRLYNEADLDRVRLIHTLQELGLSLAEIRCVVVAREGWGTGAQAAPELRRILEEQIRRARAEAARFHRLEEELRLALTLVDGCKECPEGPWGRPCPSCPNWTERSEVPLPIRGLV